MYFNVYSLPLFLVVLINLSIAIHVSRQRIKPGAQSFLYLVLTASVYAFFYAFEISSLTLKNALLFYKMQYIGISFIPACFLLFTLHYTGLSKKILKRHLFFIFFIPVLTLLFVFTNEFHQIYFSNIGLKEGIFFTHLNFIPGIWYWIHNIYSIIVLLTSLVLLGKMWNTCAPPFRKQVSVIFYGTSIPSLFYLLYIFGLFEKGLDPIPFAFFISTLIIHWGLNRYKLFDIVPLARNMLFDCVPDAVLILDMEKRIIDVNETAQKLLKIRSADLGKTSDEGLRKWPELLSQCYHSSQFEIRKHEEGCSRYFNVSVNEIVGENHIQLGWMCILRDVSEDKRNEEIKNRAESKKSQVMEALRISEEKYRNISRMLRLMNDNVPDMIWAKDLKKQYIFANKALCMNILNAENTDKPIGKTDEYFSEREKKRYPDNKQWHTKPYRRLDKQCIIFFFKRHRRCCI